MLVLEPCPLPSEIGSVPAAEFKITWATYTQPEPYSLDMQVPIKFGGAVVNTATATVTFGVSNRGGLASLHGVLMLLSFGLMLPLGTLAARHKWMFQGMEVGGCGCKYWLNSHVYVCDAL